MFWGSGGHEFVGASSNPVTAVSLSPFYRWLCLQSGHQDPCWAPSQGQVGMSAELSWTGCLSFDPQFSCNRDPSKSHQTFWISTPPFSGLQSTSYSFYLGETLNYSGLTLICLMLPFILLLLPPRLAPIFRATRTYLHGWAPNPFPGLHTLTLDLA